jgi:multidrug resistance efflux pump
VTSASTGELETTKLHLGAELALYGTIRMSIGPGELERDEAKLARVHGAFMPPSEGRGQGAEANAEIAEANAEIAEANAEIAEHRARGEMAHCPIRTLPMRMTL